MKTNQRWIMPAAVVLLIALAGIRAWPQSQQTTVGLAVGWGALILHSEESGAVNKRVWERADKPAFRIKALIAAYAVTK